MVLVNQKISATWRDAKGWTKRYTYYVTADNADAGFYTDTAAIVQALQAAITGASNAVPASKFPAGGAQVVQDLAYGNNAEYPANWMEARMMFTTAKGARAIFGIGAPKIALFDTDGVTILNDGTQAAVVAYVNAVKNGTGTAFVSTADGQAFAHFVGGILKVGRQPRRFSEMVKSSHLVQGEGE